MRRKGVEFIFTPFGCGDICCCDGRAVKRQTNGQPEMQERISKLPYYFHTEKLTKHHSSTCLYVW